MQNDKLKMFELKDFKIRKNERYVVFITVTGIFIQI